MLIFKFLKSLFKKFDLFPLNFSFFIKHQELKKTFWGGFFSLILIIVTIYIFVKNYLSFIERNDPAVRYSVEYIANNPAENVSLNDLQILHTLLKPGTLNTIKGNLISNISLNSYNYILDMKKNTLKINGNFFNCSDYKVKDLNKSLYNQFFKILGDNSTGFCFIQNKTEFILGGSALQTYEDTKIYQKLEIDLCSIQETEKICKKDDLLKLLTIGYSFSLNNKYTNLSNPLGYENFLNSFVNDISPNNDIEIKIKIVKNVINSDMNIIYDFFPDEEITFYSFQDISINTTSRKKDGILLITIKMDLDDFQNIYKRSYIKMDETLASILSIYSFMSFLCQIFVDIFEYGTLDHYFIKKLYYFVPSYKDFKSKKITLSNKTIKVYKVQAKKNSDFLSNIQEEDKVSNNYIKQNVSENEMIQIDKINNDIKKVQVKSSFESKQLVKRWKLIIEGDPPRRETIQLFIFDFIPCLSKLFIKDIKKIISAREYLTIDFNIIHLIRRILEFDKLKTILLDDKQLQIFKLCNSRIIDINRHNTIEDEINELSKKSNISQKSIETISSIYDNFLSSNKAIERKLVDYPYFIKN